MIVVCTGCSAKFRVADEKVGPRGAKLRCSKCQTVFTVQHEVETPPAPAPPPQAAPGSGPAPATDSLAAGRPRATPPPLPRRTTTLDARAAFDVDLEPHLGAPPSPADPFASLPPEPPLEPAPPPADPFGPPAAASAPVTDPFASTTAVGPPSDPFGTPADGLFGSSPGSEPAPFAAAAFDPFQPASGAAPGDPLQEPGSPAPAAPHAGPVTGGFGSLSLEELTTPPARRLPRTPATDSVPLPVMGGSEDPFASSFDPGLSVLDEGVLATAVPAAGSEARIPEPPHPGAEDEPPLQLDPFGAAAVASDPLAVDEPARPAPPPPPVETTAERRVADRTFRLRDVLVSAMALAALLLLSLAILVVWRGGLSPADAFRPSAILAALAPRPLVGSLSAQGVSSGLYERAHGPPLLFVRGTVVSTAATPLDGVRVVVEVVRDGAVLIAGEVPVGAVPGPEALHAADDGAALARALADAAAGGGARLAPGGSAPFLIAFTDYPANLGGASLRVRTVAGEAR